MRDLEIWTMSSSVALLGHINPNTMTNFPFSTMTQLKEMTAVEMNLSIQMTLRNPDSSQNECLLHILETMTEPTELGHFS